MAEWVTHLMIADALLLQLPQLHRRGFCIGSIAPDCNVENADWTSFTPPREVTHWMRGEHKQLHDCHTFYAERILPCHADSSSEAYAFLLGYYAHLLTDAAYQAFIRNEQRVCNLWRRIKAEPEYAHGSAGLPETWDTVKRLIPKAIRSQEIHNFEAAYLHAHPSSGYLTEILPLQDFPDYLDILPSGAIVRKIRVMGGIPKGLPDLHPIVITSEEFTNFVTDTTALIIAAFQKVHLI